MSMKSVWQELGVQDSLGLFSRNSFQTISKPPPMIRNTPGNKRPKGASEKKIQPRMKEKGILKYSNGERVLGVVISLAHAVKPVAARNFKGSGTGHGTGVGGIGRGASQHGNPILHGFAPTRRQQATRL